MWSHHLVVAIYPICLKIYVRKIPSTERQKIKRHKQDYQDRLA